ncbi:MAG TPA: hypothetical protein VFS43_43880 [Polyangiaceae bacterium]|nr:hypothetical protein [Polyangiaceae bacterium]
MPPTITAEMGEGRGIGVAVGAGVLASLPALVVGFFHDDFLQRLALEGALPGYAPGPFRLYDFTWGGEAQVAQMIADGKLPWFADPGLGLRFFRPLSSLTLAVDAWAFGRNALAAHVHSIAWFVLLSAAVVALYRRWLGRRAAAWASFAYVLAGGHAMTTAWLSARHGLVGAAFGALALLAHARWRDDRWRPGAWLGPISLAAGLCASEVALGAVAFWVCDEAFARGGGAREGGPPAGAGERAALLGGAGERARAALLGGAGERVRAALPGGAYERVRAALPALAVAGAFLIFYAAGHYGTRRSGAYISPFDDPRGFAAAALVRVPTLLAEVYAALPSVLAAAAPPLALPFAALGALAAAGVGLALWALRAEFEPGVRRRLLALGLASGGAIVPTAGGIVGGRVLPIASIGGAALVGALLAAAFARARASRGARRLGLGALAGLFALLHFGLSPLVRVGTAFLFRQNVEDERAYAERAETPACPAGSVGYIVNGSDPVNSLYAAPSLLFYRPERVAHLAGVRVLSMAQNDLRLRGLGGGAFELEALGPRRANLFERVYRDAPLRAGDEVRAGELGARVLAAEAGLPTRVAFRVEGGLGRACFLAWREGRLARVGAPEAGVTLDVPFAPGPLGQ